MDPYIIDLQINQSMNDTYDGNDVDNGSDGYEHTVNNTNQSFNNMILISVSLIIMSISCLTACCRYHEDRSSTKNTLGEKILFTDIMSSDECSICLEKFKVDDKIIQLKCSHKYHTQCITKWFDKDKSCPICRQSPV